MATLLVLTTFASAVATDDDSAPASPIGLNGLFIGHSFFVPVARVFDTLSRELGIVGHQASFVFAGGARGAPGALWGNRSKRASIEQILASGHIELLGLTAAHRGSDYEDYQRWIDLALQYNPDTAFLIARAWVTGGPRKKTASFDEQIEAAGESLFEIVVALRRAYPDTTIHYLNYGGVAALMKAKFEAGELEDIDQLVGRSKGALFRDRFTGHAGPMILELSALIWLAFLYGVPPPEAPKLAYDAASIDRIVIQVLRDNQNYNRSWVR